ncbi:MAG: DUF3551 domain-containing protein [Pseudomonadota bacterium]
MKRIALTFAALSAILCFDSPPTQAGTYGNAPWCAVMETGSGSYEVDCGYYSVQQCTPNVIAGNRGFCQMNPYWRSSPTPFAYARRHR